MDARLAVKECGHIFFYELIYCRKLNLLVPILKIAWLHFAHVETWIKIPTTLNVKTISNGFIYSALSAARMRISYASLTAIEIMIPTSKSAHVKKIARTGARVPTTLAKGQLHLL